MWRHCPEPVQGWEQWCRDIEDIVSVCESQAAIDLVQDRNREMLVGLKREQQCLYQRLGERFNARRDELQRPAPSARPRKGGLEPSARH